MAYNISYDRNSNNNFTFMDQTLQQQHIKNIFQQQRGIANDSQQTSQFPHPESDQQQSSNKFINTNKQQHIISALTGIICQGSNQNQNNSNNTQENPIFHLQMQDLFLGTQNQNFFNEPGNASFYSLPHQHIANHIRSNQPNNVPMQEQVMQNIGSNNQQMPYFLPGLMFKPEENIFQHYVSDNKKNEYNFTYQFENNQQQNYFQTCKNFFGEMQLNPSCLSANPELQTFQIFDAMLNELQQIIDNVLYSGTASREDLGAAIQKVFTWTVRENIQNLQFKQNFFDNANENINNQESSYINHVNNDPVEQRRFAYHQLILELATVQLGHKIIQHICLVEDTPKFRQKIKERQLIHVLPRLEQQFRAQSRRKKDKLAVIQELSIIGNINWDHLISEIYQRIKKMPEFDNLIQENEIQNENAYIINNSFNIATQSQSLTKNTLKSQSDQPAFSVQSTTSPVPSSDKPTDQVIGNELSDSFQCPNTQVSGLQQLSIIELMETIYTYQRRKEMARLSFNNDQRTKFDRAKNEIKIRYENDIIGKQRIHTLDNRNVQPVKLNFKLQQTESACLQPLKNNVYSQTQFQNPIQLENVIVFEPLHLKKTTEIKRKQIIFLNKYTTTFITALTLYNWLCQKDNFEDQQLMYNYFDLYEIYKYTGKVSQKIQKNFQLHAHGAQKSFRQFVFAFNCYKQYKWIYYQMIEEVRLLYIRE